MIKSDVLHLRVEAGSAATRLALIEDRLAALESKIDRNHAEIVGLLSRLVGEDPNAI
ncbi:hypothetical protein [Streptomyces fuscigenes]|uniref:hypothetical protein n=1 Tax=Streptomyces fuscigenes TaxID=1528880 RepID=UPI001F1E8A2A|nr:hypothetical protein [Streptomyces fuscigenes]MCF3960442.1 hypothetical protein [Streptomyces fuscigenes]